MTTRFFLKDPLVVSAGRSFDTRASRALRTSGQCIEPCGAWGFLGICIMAALVVAGCGRKQRGVYDFPQKQLVKVNRLTLPVVKGLAATAQQKKVTLTWRAVVTPAKTNFLGYSVYRLAQGRFIPKQPITKKPILETTYTDKHAKHSAKDGVVSYVVRGVFEVEGQTVQGLTSQVVSVTLK